MKKILSDLFHPPLALLVMGFFPTACSGQSEGPAPNIPAPSPPTDLGWEFENTPIWQDEFDYDGYPDPEKWGYDTGGHGWGNNELQFYTEDLENAKVGNGVLTITAKNEAKEANDFTSARLVSKGKGDFLYGRIEVKARLPKGKGTWPAIWMLPTDWEYGGWPASGEIDIMEHVGYDQGTVHITVHTEAFNHKMGTQVGKNRKVEHVSKAYHTYRVDWTPYAIRGYIDDALLFTFTNDGKGYASWPFDKPFHVLLNLAVGGDWGGAEGVDQEAFPASFSIDYVRVYRMIEK
ncbi:glycoside hydrolase family 16 protein [Echinicola soli]|uniref:Glycoside hydrolase family 16 protein n=1 Tax=Echinicola soli TaxID=2591634 RepID=A0A514CH73_9BACT|nr:glycoside hydrolase family 16 protein [Echinicola soli]QDH79167.1 glycoside hydrolase family 16 protein [Echinicola soli]